MSGEIILYTTEDGGTRVYLREIDGFVWLTQAEMAELFQVTPQAITQHVRSVYAEGEWVESATCKEDLQVRMEGKRRVSRSISLYSLAIILAVGFRVRSPRGTQFRRWAAASLGEYLVKGFAMDDARLKDPDAGYFEELLARIRDIRSSEKLFYLKVLEIYATSVDYDPKTATSELFFQTVQNKMHWAAHGHTAAEVIHARANAAKDHMGLTSWGAQSKGGRPSRRDVTTAKNYLLGDEIETLNRIVTAYLEFAELQAMNRKPMHMTDWVRKLDDFLKLSDRDVLAHAGRISAENAKLKAETQFDAWNMRVVDQPSAVELHFSQAIATTKKIQASTKKPLTRGKKDAS